MAALTKIVPMSQFLNELATQGQSMHVRPTAGSDPASRRKYRYYRNCVEHTDADVHLLEDMIENAIDVSYYTFFRHVSHAEATELLGYAKHYMHGLTLLKDWHVSYHRSKYNGCRCYYLRHSAIEYIWLPETYEPGES